MASTLPSPADCCAPACCDNETVEVPGPQGPAGADGTDGTDGVNAFTTITDAFNMPAVNADTASLLVGNSQWMTPTQIIYVQNAGYMEVRSMADATHVVLRNVGYTGNAGVGDPIGGGQAASPAGLAGQDGANGSNGTNGSDGVNSFTSLTNQFTQPAIAGTETIDVGNSDWMSVGQVIYISTGGYYEVINVNSSVEIEVENLGYAGNETAGQPVEIPATISPGGLIGATGATGPAGGTSVSSDEQAGVGTDYGLLAAYDQVVFGTTQAEVVLLGAGRYLIQAIVGVVTSGTPFEHYNFKLRDATGAADITGSEQTQILENDTQVQVVLSAIFTAAGGETIQIWGQNTDSGGPPSGSVKSTETKLWYLKLT